MSNIQFTMQVDSFLNYLWYHVRVGLVKRTNIHGNPLLRRYGLRGYYVQEAVSVISMHRAICVLIGKTLDRFTPSILQCGLSW